LSDIKSDGVIPSQRAEQRFTANSERYFRGGVVICAMAALCRRFFRSRWRAFVMPVVLPCTFSNYSRRSVRAAEAGKLNGKRPKCLMLAGFPLQWNVAAPGGRRGCARARLLPAPEASFSQ
jgi:hypothetical protein